MSKRKVEITSFLSIEPDQVPQVGYHIQKDGVLEKTVLLPRPKEATRERIMEQKNALDCGIYMRGHTPLGLLHDDKY